ncbi:MAG: transposase [Deltaproteobacteria bacterium]|nr:transposase [Deltaproteobacteria bacterium]
MTTITALTAEERRLLEAWTRDRRAKPRAERARIVLLSAGGADVAQIAASTGVGDQTVRKWLRRFDADRLAGLMDGERTGAPTKFSAEDVERVVAHTLARDAEDAPGGAWSTRALAKLTGLSQSSVSRIWRSFGLSPDAPEDPPFGDDVRDVLGVFADGDSLAAVVVTDGDDGASRAIASRLRSARRTITPGDGDGGGGLGGFLRTCEAFASGRELYLVASRASQTAGQVGVMWSWLEFDARHHLHFVPTEDAARRLIHRWFARLTGTPLGWASDRRSLPVPSFSRYAALQAQPNQKPPGSE